MGLGRWWQGLAGVPALFRVPGVKGVAAAAPSPNGCLLAGAPLERARLERGGQGKGPA